MNKWDYTPEQFKKMPILGDKLKVGMVITCNSHSCKCFNRVTETKIDKNGNLQFKAEPVHGLSLSSKWMYSYDFSDMRLFEGSTEENPLVAHLKSLT